MPTISLCMIVKNEEQFLEKCLNSVTNLVDEIVIIDTGSTDRTKEIAAKFTTKIYDFFWSNDFSAARNESLKHATKDWILILDADESISLKDHSRIKQLVSSTQDVGFFLIHRNYINSSEAVGWTSSKNDSYEESNVAAGWFSEPVLRLFINRKDVLFEGVVHESVYLSLGKQGNISETAIPIHHYGKLNQEKLKEKEKLYEGLGENKVNQQKKDFYSYFELGRQYTSNAKYEEAISALEKSIELNPDYFESWFMLGSIFLILGKLDLAFGKLMRAQALNHNFSSTYINLGIIYVKKKEYKKAVEKFIKALELTPLDATAYFNLGLCYDEMGNQEKAYRALKKAVELNPEYRNSVHFK